MAFLVENDAQKKWDQFSDKNQKDLNFYVTEFVKGKPCKLATFAEGGGGLDELRSILEKNANKALFGILKVVFYDDKNCPYVKFVYFKFVGSKVPVMTKGFLTPNLGNIEKAFPVQHLTYMLAEELDKFDMKHISANFDRVTENIVEIQYFDYGPNQTYKWAKKVGKPNMDNNKNQDDEKQNYNEPAAEPEPEPEQEPEPEPESEPQYDDPEPQEQADYNQDNDDNGGQDDQGDQGGDY